MSGKIFKRAIATLTLSSVALLGPIPQSHATTRSTVGYALPTFANVAPKVTKPMAAPQVANNATRVLPLELRALKIAESKTGAPYSWGATGPWSFDCSGLVYYSYRKAGKHIPRTAGEQQNYAHRVYSPRPGDLVFFGWPAYHVGIYVGNGKFLNAPHTGDSVEIDPIWYDGTPSSYGRIN
jgi:cell wall-associated NlpC family hydrolase